MFSLMFHRSLPKCKNCIHYIPTTSMLNNKHDKINYRYVDLGKCKKFNMYSEIARMDDLKCSVFGFKFVHKH